MTYNERTQEPELETRAMSQAGYSRLAAQQEKQRLIEQSKQQTASQPENSEPDQKQ